MAVFQCFFFSSGKIGYWDNVECDTEGSLRSLLQRILRDSQWDAAEAWKGSRLVCRLEIDTDGISDLAPTVGSH
jgi:hypothetical protein